MEPEIVIISNQTFEALEQYSCKMEIIRDTIGIMHNLLMDADDRTAIKQAMILSENLLDISAVRCNDINEIISSVVHVKGKF